MRLEAEGAIYRINRKGWFVNTAKLNWDPVKKANFYTLALEQGFSPKTQLVTHTLVCGDKQIRQAFSLAPADKLQQITRVRYLDGRPVVYEVIYCRAQDFPDLARHQLAGSLTQIFTEHYGVNVSHEHSKIFVSALPREKAQMLGQNESASCLKIHRQRYNQANALVDYNIEYWVHSAIELEVASYIETPPTP